MSAASVITLVACSGTNGDPSDAAREPDRVVCEIPVVPPEGFEPRKMFEETYRDHVGIRRGFRDDEGRELFAFAGIPGEFGEGLPDVETVELADGRMATLISDPLREVWVMTWQEGGVCDPRALFATGFTRKAFHRLLEDVGLVGATM